MSIQRVLLGLMRLAAKKARRERKRIRGITKFKDFRLIGIIGIGRFGEVYIARDKRSGLVFAIKVLDKRLFKCREHRIRLYHEIFLHSALKNHPNIVNHYSHFYGRKTIYCLQEFVTKGTLHERLLRFERLPECEVARYIAQVANALHHCHLLGFVHGDIKPENILLDDFGNVKLSDFGFAWSNLVSTNINMCATPEYCPPEVLREEDYEFPGDVWSLGVLFYELIVGMNPFYNPNPDIMRAYILTAAVTSSDFLSPEAHAFVSEMLTVRPCDRLTLVQVMQHKWIVERYGDISSFIVIGGSERDHKVNIPKTGSWNPLFL